MGTRTVRLFRNGRNQAVRIPREFELPGRAIARRGESSSERRVPQRTATGTRLATGTTASVFGSLGHWISHLLDLWFLPPAACGLRQCLLDAYE